MLTCLLPRAFANKLAQLILLHVNVHPTTCLTNPRRSHHSTSYTRNKSAAKNRCLSREADSIICKLAYNVIWHLLATFFFQATKKLVSLEQSWQHLVGDLCGADTVAGVSDYKANRKEAVSLFMTATVFFFFFFYSGGK